MKRLVFAVCLIVPAALAQTNATPFLGQLYPVSTHPGRGAFTLNVTGAGFTSGSIVQWNRSPRSTIFVSPHRLQAAITAADVSSAGSAVITVFNPAPGGGTSNVIYFPVGLRSQSIAYARRDIPEVGLGGTVVGDFNNDGKLDVLTGAGTLLGNGDGTFQPPLPFQPAGGVLLAADINGDGILDLVVDAGWGNLLFYQGNGDGTFTPNPNPLYGFLAEAAGDFNRDGKLDLLTVRSDISGLYLEFFFGNGDFTFSSPQLMSLGSGGSVALGDFNGDGLLDLSLTNGNQFGGDLTVGVLLGDGNGGFGGPPGAECPVNCGPLFTGDVNGDGNLDVVTMSAYPENAEVILYLGNGDGTLTEHIGPSVPFGTSLVALADLNDDGKLDLLAVEPAIDPVATVVAMFGNGDGTFQAPQAVTTAGGALPGDFNGSGRLGFIATGPSLVTGQPVLSVFLPTTLGIFPTFMNFGQVAVGTTSPAQTVTLNNIGNATVSIGPIKASGNKVQFHGSSDCTNLNPGASCTITGTFEPKWKGTFSVSIEVGYNGAVGSPQYIEVTGSGIN